MRRVARKAYAISVVRMPVIVSTPSYGDFVDALHAVQHIQQLIAVCAHGDAEARGQAAALCRAEDHLLQGSSESTRDHVNAALTAQLALH